jgi:hypothetical protein
MNKIDKFCNLINSKKYPQRMVSIDETIRLAREIFDDKPMLKPVDLSVLIVSGIDCEFSTNINFTPGTIMVNKLESFSPETRYVHSGWNAPYCRPRMTPFIHASPNGFDSCPLPEGLKIKIYFRDGKASTVYILRDHRTFRFDSDHDIIAFEVLGLADGFCWPWEGDHEHTL